MLLNAYKCCYAFSEAVRFLELVLFANTRDILITVKTTLRNGSEASKAFRARNLVSVADTTVVSIQGSWLNQCFQL